MNRNSRAIILFILLCLTLIPSEAICASSAIRNIPSKDYILTRNHADVTFVQGDEDYYVVQNRANSEITSVNQQEQSDLIFGEDAITEDNILKHYIFKNKTVEQSSAYRQMH